MREVETIRGMSALGMGTTQFWYGRKREAEDCIAYVIDHHLMNVIDTAEMYGHGICEDVLRHIIQRCGRDNIFLTDKVLPEHVSEKQMRKSLETSLERMDTDYIDLYLLHWRELADLEILGEMMETFRQEGKILHWGVSNFDVADLEDLMQTKYGSKCICNQIYYNTGVRGPEFDLFPYMKQHHILPMSYTTMGTKEVRKKLNDDPLISEWMKEQDCTVEALMLAFALREPDLCALFQTSSLSHLYSNLKCLEMDISGIMPEIDRLYPAPVCKTELEKR